MAQDFVLESRNLLEVSDLVIFFIPFYCIVLFRGRNVTCQKTVTRAGLSKIVRAWSLFLKSSFMSRNPKFLNSIKMKF